MHFHARCSYEKQSSRSSTSWACCVHHHRHFCSRDASPNQYWLLTAFFVDGEANLGSSFQKSLHCGSCLINPGSTAAALCPWRAEGMELKVCSPSPASVPFLGPCAGDFLLFIVRPGNRLWCHKTWRVIKRNKPGNTGKAQPGGRGTQKLHLFLSCT